MTENMAIEKRKETQPTKTIRAMLDGEDFKRQVERVLPKFLSPDRFIRCALTTIMRNPKLATCDQSSFFNSLLTLSQFGLEPDGRVAHLIPFDNKKRGCVECQLIIDYKGLVEVVMRNPDVQYVHADVVCENDEFEFNLGAVVNHKVDFRKPRGNAYAVYARCVFRDGTSRDDCMSVDEINAIRNRSRAGNSGPWVTDWTEMAKKTVFRRLSKWLPLSVEYKQIAYGDDDVIDVNADGAVSTPAPERATISMEDLVKKEEESVGAEDEETETKKAFLREQIATAVDRKKIPGDVFVAICDDVGEIYEEMDVVALEKVLSLTLRWTAPKEGELV